MAILPLPDVDVMTELGFCTVLFFLLGYGFILLQGAILIGDGSELLFLIYGPGVIGGLIIPLLGAIPDAAVIGFSGLGGGPKAKIQKSIEVGIGALAGSTVMLLTVPFVTTILAGQSYLDMKTNRMKKRIPKKVKNAKMLDYMKCMGIAVETSVKSATWTMVLSCISFLVILIPAFMWGTAAAENVPAGIGMITCFCAFLLYGYHCTHDANVLALQKAKEHRRAFERWKSTASKFLHQKDDHVYRQIYDTFDKDQNGQLTIEELKQGLENMGLKESRRDLFAVFQKFDTDHDGTISREEFETQMKTWMSQQEFVVNRDTEDAALIQDEMLSDEESEEDELLEFTNAQLLQKAMLKLVGGTLLVILFSDPMVDAIQAFATCIDVPAFFVSFLVVPLASNAAELVSAYTFALKKNKESSTVGVATCFGAAVMNNTVCLGVFFALIYFFELKWTFFAETLGLIFIQLTMAYIGQKDFFTLVDAAVIGGIFFAAIIFIAILRLIFEEKN